MKMRWEAGDLVRSELIRFYHQEMIYSACVRFRKTLLEIIDNEDIPVDIAINVTQPSEFDVERYKQKIHEKEKE